MNKLYTLTLLGIALLFSGCLNQDTPSVYYDVEGRVLENGSPVPRAQIHFRNNFDPGGFRDEVIGDSVTISFNSSSVDVYRASIFRNGADSVLSTFFEDTLGMGVQNILVPDSLLSNGVYGYELSTEYQYFGANFFIVNKPESELIETIPPTVTDFDGNFEINAGYLALTQELRFSDGERFEITDSLQIIVVQDSVVKAVENVKIEPDEENYFEINLD